MGLTFTGRPFLHIIGSMKRNIRIMYLMALLQGMVFYGPIATLYRQARGISVFQITIIEGISLALCLILEIPWGVIADRIGYRRTMIICSWLYFVSKIVFWKATDFSGFLAERIMLSIVIAGLSGVDSSILYLSNNGEDMQKVYGRYQTIGTLGLLLAAGFFSLVVRDNYALAGFCTVISYGIAALLSLGITEVKKSPTEAEKAEPLLASFREVFQNRTLILFLAATALLSEAHQTITVFLNQVKYESVGIGTSAIGVIYIIATLLGLLGFCSFYVTKHLGTLRSLVLFALLPLCSCILLGITKTALPAVCGVMLLRLSDTLFQPLQEEIRNKQVTSENRATALSIFSMLISTVGIVTNLIFGRLSDLNLNAAFLFGGGICTLSLIFLVVWYRKNRYALSESDPN